jgi:restriction endonuclease S subunit
LNDYIDQANGGAGLAYIKKGEFESSVLLIPPLPEQDRIVSKVDELLTGVNSARERLAKVPGILKQFRQSVLAAACSGYGQRNINIAILSDVFIPFPPLAEQHEIVRRVEALFRLANAIEARVAAGAHRANRLTQAILAKAFRGELVPTEANHPARKAGTLSPPPCSWRALKKNAA